MVVLSANLKTILELYLAEQSQVKRRLRTHPCGALVLSVNGEDIWLLVLTSRGLSVRKSRI